MHIPAARAPPVADPTSARTPSRLAAALVWPVDSEPGARLPGCPVARLPGSGEDGDVIDQWLRFRTCEPGFLGSAFESGAGSNRAGLHFPRKRAKSEYQQVVPVGTSWYQLVPAGTSWYQLVPAGTSWYQLVPASTSWHQLVPAGTS